MHRGCTGKLAQHIGPFSRCPDVHVRSWGQTSHRRCNLVPGKDDPLLTLDRIGDQSAPSSLRYLSQTSVGSGVSVQIDDHADRGAISSVLTHSKFRPLASTAQAMRASLLASAMARTLWCSRFFAALIQDLSPCRSQLWGLKKVRSRERCGSGNDAAPLPRSSPKKVYEKLYFAALHCCRPITRATSPSARVRLEVSFRG